MHTLFLSSNAIANSPLAVDKEYNRVRKKLEPILGDTREAVDHWPDVQLDDLVTRLRASKPSIVHFSGHGSPKGELWMKDHDGVGTWMGAEGLTGILAAFKDTVRMVVLNACYSEVLATSIAEHVDVVIGMDTTVSDDAAILFSQTFYEGLAMNESASSAFELAKNVVRARFPDEGETPKIKPRSHVDPSAVRFPY